MNAVRKRPQLNPSRPPITIATSRSVQPTSHDAPRLPPDTPVAGGSDRGVVEEEEEQGEGEEEDEELLLVEEDTTDSSLIITMGNAHTRNVAKRVIDTTSLG